MTMKGHKTGILFIAAVLLVVAAFAGVVSAQNIASVQDWNSFAANSVNYNTDINLVADLDFSTVGGAIHPLNKTSYTGNITGNGHIISNFKIDGSNSGLIGSYYRTDGYDGYITNLILRNFSVNSNGGSGVGGLLGIAISAIHFENVHVEYGNVTSSLANVGGLLGYTNSAIWMNNTYAERMYLSTNQYIGGLLGQSYSASSYINDCRVSVSEISGDYVGGLVGWVYSGSVNFTNASVMDCKIGKLGSGDNGVGGLVGNAQGPLTYNECAVENCTVEGSNRVGGLVGRAGSTSNFETATSWVNYTWVNASVNWVGSMFGYYTSGGSIVCLPLHTAVYSNYGSSSTAGDSIDNTFNGVSPADPANIGSRVGSTLFAGIDYGYLVYTITNQSSDSSKGYMTVNKSKAEFGMGVSAEAFANPGYHFVNWTCINLTPSSDTVNPYNFRMPAKNVNITANFAENISTIFFHNDTSVIESKINVVGTGVNFTAVPTKSGYTGYWNVSESGKALTNSTYVTNGKWTFTGDNNSVLHAYVNWTENPPAPASSYSSSAKSSSPNYGYTQILQPIADATQTPTVAPTTAPVDDAPPIPVAPAAPASSSSSTKPTQKSPAPVAGLIAGLGAVALLLRARK